MINENITLRLSNGKKAYYNKIIIDKYKRELKKILGMYDLKKHQEDIIIPAEFYYDFSPDYKHKNCRLTNLLNAFIFIIQRPEINKENLKKLYSIISKNLLDEKNQESMGEYYRNENVVVLNQGYFDYDKTIDKEEVPIYMHSLHEYIKEDNKKDMVDYFIKSQIIHFYFVYIHPYFDCNGRTARTVSSWYLLEKEAYPFLVFDRTILLHEKEYLKAIRKARRTGDLTKFLSFILKRVKEELEKDIIIDNIDIELSDEEKRAIKLFLSLNDKTITSLANIYRYDKKLSVKQTIENIIMPLVDKDIIQITKKVPNEKDYFIELNPKYKEVIYESRKHWKTNQRVTSKK